MRTAQRDAAEATRTITGTSGGGVSLATGPGWRIERIGVGVYDVRLFGVRAIVAVQVTGVGGAHVYAVPSVTQPDTFRYSAWNMASAPIDAIFTFTATVR